MIRVYADMVADLFHVGHVEFLRRASALGDYLLVGVHDDDAVEGYKRRPVMNLGERVGVVSACRYVDEVLPAAPVRVTRAFILEHEIDLVVHAHAPSEPHLYEEFYREAIDMGRFRRLDYSGIVSTSDIIRRILAGDG